MAWMVEHFGIQSFGPLFYVYRPETSRCGLLNLVNGTKIAIEGRDCLYDEAQFICKYGKKKMVENIGD